MKHQQLINHINGSILKEEFLEAFLVQSAYIEGLLKMFAVYKFYSDFEIEKAEKALSFFKEEIDNYTFDKLIKFLKKTDQIDNQLCQKLYSYKDKRNKVIHDLLNQMFVIEDFDKEIESVCNLGIEIVTDDQFGKVTEFVELVEESVARDKTNEAAITNSGGESKAKGQE